MKAKSLIATLVGIGLILLHSVGIAAEPPIVALTFTPQGEQILAGSQAGIVVYDWPSLEQTRQFDPLVGHVHDVAFSPNGKWLAVVGGAPSEIGRLRVLAWPSLEMIAEHTSHDDVIYSVDWRFDSSQLVTAGNDHVVEILNFNAPVDANLRDVQGVGAGNGVSPKATLRGHSRAVFAATYVGQELFVSGGADRNLRVWNHSTGRLLRVFNQHTDIVNSIAARPSGTLPMIASASADRTVRFWQPTIGRLVRFVRMESQPLALAWSRDGRWVAAACDDGHVRIIDPNKAKVVGEYGLIDGWAYAIAATPDNRFVAGGTRGKIGIVAWKPPQ